MIPILANNLIPTILVAAVATLVAILIFMLVIRSKKPFPEPVDQSFLDNLVIALGGKENILKAEKEHQRLKVTVENVKLLQSATLKELELAAFLKGKEVTLLVKHQSEKVLSYLNEQRKEV
jgi:phosphotransferase system IIB component